ncbi:hypothetical protein EDC96DRAFT_511098 [Choanephora cucurbitarum]|nr:hypothetical protein EDC96DRAFT_511098 [Choanephora cucurbitarum]
MYISLFITYLYTYILELCFDFLTIFIIYFHFFSASCMLHSISPLLFICFSFFQF